MRPAMWLLSLMMMLMQGNLFYPATLKVTKVEKGVVTMEDRRGHAYTVSEDEAWDVGDYASCIMYSNGTFDKADDEILTAEYAWR